MGETKKNSLLIVDDEKSNIMTLTSILSPEYVIYAAKSGADGVEAAYEYLPDVVLLDILMPGMDGYAVIAALKKADETRQIPVIFITGLNSPSDEEKGLSLGAADYICKPFSPAIVKLRVNRQIERLNHVRIIEQLSMTDQLTGLPNRRNFDERLQIEWNRAIRDKAPLSILIMDLDDFKQYNDTYGHQQGDAALQELARVFTHELKRSVDYIARWGGEEFVVLLTNTDANDALSTAERLRERVGNSQILLADGSATKVTVSIGVDSTIPTPIGSVRDFIYHADEALYTSKKCGRNRICRFESAG